MAENNEKSSNHSEGIISRLKEFVVSGWKKIAEIASSINGAVNKVLDSLEDNLTGKNNSSTPPSTETPATTPSPEPTAPTPPSSPEPKPPATEPTEQVAAQTEEIPAPPETEPLSQKINLISGKIDDTTKQTIKPVLETMSTPPTKEDVKRAVINIIQNADSNSQTTVTIPPIGTGNNGLPAEESAAAMLEAINESQEFTDNVKQINILINNPAAKIAFDQTFNNEIQEAA